jgi:hypothetical protein
LGRGKKIIISAGVSLILLVSVFGCASEQSTSDAVPTTTITPSVTSKGPRATNTIHIVPNPPTRTPTIFLTTTPRPNVYDWSTPKPTLTMDVINSKLAGSEVICPIENPIDQQALALLIEPTGQYGFEYGGGFIPGLSDGKIINLLNQYGTTSFLSYLDHNISKYFIGYKVQFLDITMDGINELIIQWGNTYVFSCREGQYILLGKFDMDTYFNTPYFVKTIDGNLNGYPELLVDEGTASQGGRAYGLYEYNGVGIISVIDPEQRDLNVEPYGTVNYRNIDGDAVSEIVVYRGIPSRLDYDFLLPWRDEWDIYDWDGEYYTLTDIKFSAPQYRFQAAVDGDRYTLYKKYEKALSSYQNVIFSDKLDWWSAERRSYMVDHIHWEASEPTPVMPEMDPDEYNYLAAYARYRIMLLYLLQGWDSDAQVVYNTLQVKYPEGTPGSIYARLAKTFWEKYQSSGNMGDACQSVKYDVDKNSEEVFKYLGIDGYLGMSLPKYTPQDICPFE